VHVERVVAGRSAAKDGRLKAGDKIISINGVPVQNKTNKETMEILGEASLEPRIAITVARAVASQTAPRSLHNATYSPQAPATAGPSAAATASTHAPRTPHAAGHARPTAVRASPAGPISTPADQQSQRERVPKEIRLPKTPSGLDIAIVRGQPDAQGRPTIEVQWINPTGNLGNDGRVKEGDTLLSINGHSLLNIPVENAAQLLALAKGTVGDRDEERTVELVDDTGGLGIVLGSASSGGPVRIKEVIAGSSAEAAGLKPGQEVIALNGRSTEGVTVQRANTMLAVSKVRSGGAGQTTSVTVRDSADVVLQYISNRHAPMSSATAQRAGHIVSPPAAHPSGLERTPSGRLRRQPLSPLSHDQGPARGRSRGGSRGESLRSDSPDEMSHDGTSQGDGLEGSFMFDDLDSTGVQHVGGHGDNQPFFFLLLFLLLINAQSTNNVSPPSDHWSPPAFSAQVPPCRCCC
jgi:hypothetical protein